MSTEIDELVTKLSYVVANPKVLEEADAEVSRLDKTNKEAAESTDALSQEQDELADSLEASQVKTKKLVHEQGELKRQIKLTGKATKTQKLQLLGLENRITGSRIATEKLQVQSRKLARQKKRVSAETRKLTNNQQRLAKATRGAKKALDAEAGAARKTAVSQQRLAKSTRNAEKALEAEIAAVRKADSALGRLDKQAAGVAAGNLAADAVKAGARAMFDAGKAVVTTGAEFESLRARLKTVEGSADGASIAFAKIQKFAAATPFQVQNLTKAFTQLRVRGVDPTTEKLTALGDLSSAFGRDFEQTTESIGAAARGELDSIEQLGITAKIAGDKISLTFQGQTLEVERSATAVTDALVVFGKMEGVQGAMAEQAKTLGGQFSNMQDALDAFLDLIANLGVLDEVKLIVAELGETMDDGLAQVIADVLVGALQLLRGVLVAIKGDGDGIGKTFKSFIEILKLLGNAVKILFGAFFPFTLFFKQLAPLLVTIFNLLGMVAEGINGLVGFLEKLLIIAFQPIKDLFALIVEFIQLLGVWVDEWAGVGEVWQDIKRVGDLLLGTINSVTAAMDKQAAATDAARQALAELSAEEDKRQAKKIREQELSKTASERQGGRGSKAQQARSKKQATAAAKRFDKLDDTLLASFIADPNVPPKLRDKAEKEQTRRAKSKDKKRRSAGKKAAKSERKGLLTTKITKSIADRAQKAGERAAARATLKGPISAEESNRIQREEQERVQKRITTRFEKTGELPAGLRSNISQIARTPGIAAAGGQVAPPVIAITNVRIQGVEFKIETNVASTGATAQEIAAANVAGIQSISRRDVGLAILNSQTAERR